MSFLGKSQRLVNRALAQASLQVDRSYRDFDDRLLSDTHERRMLEDLAGALERYYAGDPILPAPAEPDFQTWVREFYDAYHDSPARNAGSGSRFCNLLWLFVSARALNARLLVDSGTYTGSSAWALRLASRQAEVHSFDIDASSREIEDPSIHFHEQDWTRHDFGAFDPGGALCYFDDHVDQVQRLLEARDRGFRYLVFDDDVSVASTPRMGPSPSCLPKLQYALDERLQHDEVLEWTHHGQRHRYVIDRPYLDEAKAAIARIGKVPDLSELTGVQQQLPYTLVVLG